MKILSVDDNSENLYMLEALLRGYGHEVDSASDGHRALQLTGCGCYDLIISDILMPRMDGFQLCRELKKDVRLRHVPFIFYTATYTDPRDAAFALSLGADRFLSRSNPRCSSTRSTKSWRKRLKPRRLAPRRRTPKTRPFISKNTTRG
jgi:CheY-like chemotaxis protein